MKYVTALVLLSFFLFSACTGSKKATTDTTTTEVKKEEPAFVTWDKKFIELGEVKKGESRTMDFTFTNTSQEDAKIDIVDACECTKIEFPRGIIKPGETGKLDVIFNSHEKDESETIEIRIIFANQNKYGIPRIETLEYHFDLVK